MSSTAVRRWLEECNESVDDPGWIVEDSTLGTDWADSDAWFDTADEHLDRVSDVVVLAIARGRAGLHRSRDRDLMAGYSDSDSAPELTQAVVAAAAADIEDH